MLWFQELSSWRFQVGIHRVHLHRLTSRILNPSLDISPASVLNSFRNL